MVDFSDLVETVRTLDVAQSYDEDVRSRAREDINFIEKPDGMWEDSVRDYYENKPRFQIDKVTPIVNQIGARIMEYDFGIKVEPMGEGADEDSAALVAGIVRDTEARSNAPHIYGYSTEEMVKSGFSAWRVTADYADETSFDQELRLEQIYGAIDRVWFDPAAVKQDKSDARYAFVVNSMARDVFEKEFPNRTPSDVDQNLQYQRTYSLYDGNLVYVGQVYYVKEKTTTLALMEGPEGSQIIKELGRGDTKLYKDAGYTFINRRPIKRKTCYSRLFGPDAWLSDEEETIFSTVPVVPIYSHYSIVTNQQLYRGAVGKLKDPNRVLNYTTSTAVSQAAMAPTPKPWLTPTQAEGYENTLATINTNAQAYQLYNPDPKAPGVPQIQNPSTVNPNLLQITDAMGNAITEASGQFAASMGDSASAKHSGYAIDKLQQAGDLGTARFLKSVEIGLCRTFQLCVEAIPKIIDTDREVRVQGEDGTVEVTRVNEQVDGGIRNDLTKGRFDVTCEIGPSYKNRQQEANAGILEMAKVDPTVMVLGQDVFLSNSNTPGSDELAERARVRMIQQGIIPSTQYTEEEKQQLQEAQAIAAQQPQQPDAMMVAAQAEETKAQAAALEAQNEQAQIRLTAEGKSADIQINAAKLEYQAQKDNREFAAKVAKDNRDAEFKEAELLLKQEELNIKRDELALKGEVAVVKAVGDLSDMNTPPETN